MTDPRSSAAPASPVPPPHRQPLASIDEPTADRALRIALEAREEVRSLREEFGKIPTAIDKAGDGFAGEVFRRFDATNAKIDGATAAIAALTAELAHDREAARVAKDAEAARLAEAEKRRAPITRAGWIVLGAALTSITAATVGGLVVYVGARVHWVAPAPSAPAKVP